MSFNWPVIPFAGSEVEAFVIAYKELAESIYENFLDEVGFDENVTTGGPHLKAPFRNREIVRDLLENGLVFSSFIIQQRSGATGPGTDFVLGNSPLDSIMDSSDWSNLLKKTGCIFNDDAIVSSLRYNLEGGDPANPHSDDPTPMDDETWLENLINEIGNSDPDPDNISPDPADPPPPECSAGPKQSIGFSLANLHPNPVMRVKASALWKYVNCDGTPFTENDLGSNELNALKDKIQGFMDANISKNLNHCTALSGGGGYTVPTGGTANQCNFYNPAGHSRGLRNFLGTAVIITDVNGNVTEVRDDFDFTYGKQLTRTDGSLPGSPYNPTDVDNGWTWKTHGRDHIGNPVDPNSSSALKTWTGEVILYPPMTPTEAYQHHVDERHYVIDSHRNNGGMPVPINIQF